MSSIEAEQQRVAIFEKLVERLGPEQAKYLMSNHPPGGWEQLATKEDLKALEESTKQELKGFATKEDLKALEESTKQELKGFATKEDLKALEKSIGVEMREGFAAVHVVLAGVVEKSGKASERRAGVFYANFLTLLVLAVAIVSVVVSLD